MWEHVLKIVFDICSNIFKQCPRSVNNCRTEHLGGSFWEFWSLIVIVVVDDVIYLSHNMWMTYEKRFLTSPCVVKACSMALGRALVLISKLPILSNSQ